MVLISPPEPMLRGVVCGGANPRLEFVNAGDSNNAPTLACFDHAARRGLQAHEGTVEVRIQRVGPGGNVQVQELGRVAGAGIVDEDVQAAELLCERIDDCRCTVQIRGVQLPHNAPPAELAHLFGGLLGALLVRVPGYSDINAGLGQRDCRGAADARIGAGDDCG